MCAVHLPHLHLSVSLQRKWLPGFLADRFLSVECERVLQVLKLDLQLLSMSRHWKGKKKLMFEKCPESGPPCYLLTFLHGECQPSTWNRADLLGSLPGNSLMVKLNQYIFLNINKLTSFLLINSGFFLILIMRHDEWQVTEKYWEIKRFFIKLYLSPDVCPSTTQLVLFSVKGKR